MTTTLTAPGLSATDRCDRCNAQAYVRVVLPVEPICSSADITGAGMKARCVPRPSTSLMRRTACRTTRLLLRRNPPSSLGSREGGGTPLVEGREPLAIVT